eukprot:944449-Karenia_brevis.AAC.1
MPLGTRLQTNRWETLRDDDDDDDEEDRDSLECPAVISSSEDEGTGIPSVQDLRDMNLVTKRRT